MQMSFVNSIDLRRAGRWQTIFLILLLLFLLLCLFQLFTGHKFTAEPVEKVINVKKCCLGLTF